MSKFQYSVPELIELVRERPVIWDQKQEGYFSHKKREAWEEIYRLLVDDFDSFSLKEQEQIGNNITNKWRHTRQIFVRSLKLNPPHIPYIYHDQLQFLTGVIRRRGSYGRTRRTKLEPHEAIDDVQHSLKEIMSVKRKLSLIEQNGNAPELKLKKPKSSTVIMSYDEEADEQFEEFFMEGQSVGALSEEEYEIEEKYIAKVVEPAEDLTSAACATSTARSESPAALEDEDQAFFSSVLPTVRRMGEVDKLDFRMGVLQLIQKYMQKRRAQKVLEQYDGSSDSDE